MKTVTILIISILPALWAAAQERVPEVDLRNPDGKIVSTSDIFHPGAPVLLVFWKTNDGKCCENLASLEEAWTGTLKQKGVRMVVVCTGCNGNWTSVKPIINGNGWEFETYIDVNGDFKRAMNVGEGPCTMLFDQDEHLVCRYNSSCNGNTDYICDSFMNNLDPAAPAASLRAGK